MPYHASHNANLPATPIEGHLPPPQTRKPWHAPLVITSTQTGASTEKTITTVDIVSTVSFSVHISAGPS